MVARYRDLGIGLADASIVALAARYETNRILTSTSDTSGLSVRCEGGPSACSLRTPEPVCRRFLRPGLLQVESWKVR